IETALAARRKSGGSTRRAVVRTFPERAAVALLASLNHVVAAAADAAERDVGAVADRGRECPRRGEGICLVPPDRARAEERAIAEVAGGDADGHGALRAGECE